VFPSLWAELEAEKAGAIPVTGNYRSLLVQNGSIVKYVIIANGYLKAVYHPGRIRGSNVSDSRNPGPISAATSKIPRELLLMPAKLPQPAHSRISRAKSLFGLCSNLAVDPAESWSMRSPLPRPSGQAKIPPCASVTSKPPAAGFSRIRAAIQKQTDSKPFPKFSVPLEI
jgi:hypothetical protein